MAMGWLLKQRSLGDVARVGGRLATTTVQVAGAIATVKRFRGRLGLKERAKGEEIVERRAA
jgi:hypothetical protein